MDGLTAVGLAANVLQFLEFSIRLLSEANEVYHSASGTSNDYVELREVAQDLVKVSDSFTSEEGNQETGNTNKALNTDTGLHDIASLAKAIAEELITATQRLNVSGSHRRKWRSFRQALVSLWSKDKIESLQKRLENLRSQLIVHVLSQVNKQQACLMEELTRLRSSSGGIDSARMNDTKELFDCLKNIQDAIQEVNANTLRKTHGLLRDGTRSLESFAKEQEILKSLVYESMSHRYHTIAEAHRNTFDWILNPPRFPIHDPRSKVRIREWLISGHGIYWISGKAGSGKSTLMKYLYDSPGTSTCLRQWSRSGRLVLAASYFWSAGNDMQRNQRGLLQQILFEVLRQCPDLTSHLCSERWQQHCYRDWSLSELRTALNRLSTKIQNISICLFIDGLDEYEGDEFELIGTLQDMIISPHVKFCVSSRPLPSFEHAFGADNNLKLYLQDLTVDDIYNFARDKLAELPGFRALEEKEQTDILARVTRKADGVFLWVFLVIKSLRTGCQNDDNLGLLQERIHNIPTDLGPFFESIIRSVDPVYLDQLSTIIQIAMRAPRPVCMLTYWFLDESNSPVCEGCRGPDFSQIAELEDRMIKLLSGRYRGLLEATGVRGSRKVQFVHRTVRDYLELPTMQSLFVKPRTHTAVKAFEASVAHAKFCSGNTLSRGFNSQDFEHFMIFARWAESESRNFDWNLFDAMSSHLAGWSSNFEIYIFDEAVRFGFIACLQRSLDKDDTSIRRLSVPLLKAALDRQRHVVNSAFGIRSSYETLTWLLQHGADPNARTTNSTVFKDFISETGALARRSKTPWAYEQWHRSLYILLQHGARFDDVFSDPRLLQSLPQIGDANDSGIHNLANVDNYEGRQLHDGLNRHLDIYEAFFDHGLNPDRYISFFSLWQVWLWHICEWQIDHGRLENICVRAMKLFLDRGANIFQSVRFESGRLATTESVVWSVSDIVDGFFTEESRVEILPVLEAARRRWLERHPPPVVEQRERSSTLTRSKY